MPQTERRIGRVDQVQRLPGGGLVALHRPAQEYSRGKSSRQRRVATEERLIRGADGAAILGPEEPYIRQAAEQSSIAVWSSRSEGWVLTGWKSSSTMDSSLWRIHCRQD
ncbi:unnamed protein product [Lepidochelys olivacea]